MSRPGTQALVVSRADKMYISALFASSLVRNNVFFSLVELNVLIFTNDLLAGGKGVVGISKSVV